VPIYSFKCGNDHRWDAKRTIVERNEPIECPECGAEGKMTYRSAPTVPWYRDCTRSPYREKQKG
jgi:putative FmdB family regulatory protein